MLSFAFLIVFYFIIIPYKPVSFLMRKRKGMDPDGKGGGEDLGGGEDVGQTVIKTYMRKDSILNKVQINLYLI